MAKELNSTSLINDANLQAYYRFESGSDTTDSSANTNTLTHVNTPTNTTGQFGNGMDYELSSSEYSYAADNASLDISGSVSISAWLKPESITGTHTIVIKGRDGSVSNVTNYGFGFDSSGFLRFYYYNGSYHIYTASSNAIGTGSWKHVAVKFTFGTGSTMSLYVDGKLCSGSWTTGNGSAAAVTNTHRLQVGVIRSTTTPLEFFDGVIDDLAIFDRLLTDTEISSLAYSGLVEDGDWTGLKKLTIDSTKVFGPPGPYSLDLELSSSQYVSITDASQTGLQVQDFTVEAWVKLEQLPSTSGTHMTIVSKYDYTNVDREWLVQFRSDNTIRAYYSNDGSNATFIASTSAIVAAADVGIWTHFAVSVDVSAKTGQFYKNGVAIATNAGSGTATSVNDGASPFVIGANDEGRADYMDGMVTDVRVWSDIRTSSEIADNRHSQLVGNEANLVGYWKFSNDYTDSTSNGNDLTASGSPVFTAITGHTNFPVLIGTELDGLELNSSSLLSDASLEAYYRFESGSDTTDSSTNSNTLTHVNTPTNTTGKFGNGMDYEFGSSQYSYIADGSQTGLDITGDISFSAWIKPETVSGNYIVVSKWLGTGDQRSYQMWHDASGYLYVDYSVDGTASNYVRCRSDSTGVITAGSWIHVAATVDVSEAIGRLYVNGVEIPSTSTETGTARSIYNSTASFGVGGQDGWVNLYDGIIDDLAVFSRIISAEEVNSLMISGSNISSDVYTALSLGSYSLDLERSSNEYVRITDASQTGLDITGDLTAECWFNAESIGIAQDLMSKSTTPGDFSWIFRLTAANEIQFFTSAAGASVKWGTVSYTPTVGKWTHYAVTYDASAGSCTFYVNGQQQGATQTGLDTSLHNADAPFQVSGYDGSTNYVDGKIKHVRVFNDIRTDAEIVSDMNSASVSDANLQGEWSFENVYTDSSGNSNTLTTSGSPVFNSTDVPSKQAEIRLTSDETGTTEIPLQIVSLNTVAKIAEIWTKVPTVSYNTDTIFYMWYGNSSALPYSSGSLFGSQNVWNNGYKGVWHMEEASGTRYDSTVNANNLTDNNTVLSASGKIGTGADFEADNSEVLTISDAAQTGLDITGSMKISTWIKPESIPSESNIFAKWWSVTNQRSYRLVLNSSGNVVFQSTTNGLGATASGATSSAALSAGTMYRIAAVFHNDGTIYLMINGVIDTIDTGNGTSIFSGSATVEVGAATNVSFVDGILDELTVLTGSVSPDWESTEYANQNSPSAFLIMTSTFTPDANLTLMGVG